MMWLNEFHFDGLRVDSIKTMRRRDATMVRPSKALTYSPLLFVGTHGRN